MLACVHAHRHTPYALHFPLRKILMHHSFFPVSPSPGHLINLPFAARSSHTFVFLVMSLNFFLGAFLSLLQSTTALNLPHRSPSRIRLILLIHLFPLMRFFRSSLSLISLTAPHSSTSSSPFFSSFYSLLPRFPVPRLPYSFTSKLLVI